MQEHNCAKHNMYCAQGQSKTFPEFTNIKTIFFKWQILAFTFDTSCYTLTANTCLQLYLQETNCEELYTRMLNQTKVIKVEQAS